jgi:hypothetical protein
MNILPKYLAGPLKVITDLHRLGMLLGRNFSSVDTFRKILERWLQAAPLLIHWLALSEIAVGTAPHRIGSPQMVAVGNENSGYA